MVIQGVTKTQSLIHELTQISLVCPKRICDEINARGNTKTHADELIRVRGGTDAAAAMIYKAKPVHESVTET